MGSWCDLTKDPEVCSLYPSQSLELKNVGFVDYLNQFIFSDTNDREMLSR